MTTPALIDIYDGIATSKHFKHLRGHGSTLVPGVGPEDARVMVIGDAPGATETNAGVPFQGRSGAILNQLLAVAGLNRPDVFLTYVLKYRTPGNRPPSTAEAMRAQKFLRAEWLEVKPLVTIAAGNLAAAAIGAEDGIHGALFPYWYDEETGVYHKVSLVYHPAFGRKSAKARKWIEKEWTMLGDELREHAPQALCKQCQGSAPRGKAPCRCNGTLPD